MSVWLRSGCLVALTPLLLGLTPPTLPTDWPRFSPDELTLATSLELKSHSRPPADPSNRWADNPKAAALGKALFFDPRLSANGKISCATCHRPDTHFADTTRFSRALGSTQRNTPGLLGSSWSRWFFWDGRSDSQWAQALSPLLHPDEQGLTRTGLIHRLHQHHHASYTRLFGALPPASSLPRNAGPEGSPAAQHAWKRLSPAKRLAVNTTLANLGKAIAAYERTLIPAPARFDRFATALGRGEFAQARTTLTRDEIQGFRLFVGSARCIQCHNGPLFSNHQFHNTGLHVSDQLLHMGHADGWPRARQSDFSCLGPHSDNRQQCPSRFTGLTTNLPTGNFKTPSLRNVAHTAPYMRTGELATLDNVIEHYDLGSRTPGRPLEMGNELQRLNLTPLERQQLKAFLLTLSSESASEPAP